MDLMDFIDLMRQRGQLAQITHEDELRSHLRSAQRTAYVGFDPTGLSLHVGHLMPIMGLRRFQQAGHRVIAIVGGGTALVGDPTGKTEMRQFLTPEQIRTNLLGIRKQLNHFIDLEDPNKGMILDNSEWLAKLNYLEVLREVGPHFSVNRMLTAECFRQRLEKGLSFLEFNYMILQSYDFLHLFREHRCTLQLGGDDQWSNILGGMELVRRLVPNGQAFCMTFPLLTTTDGRKMGKTEKGSVWLDGTMTSPYEYFQYWRNIEDAKVSECLSYFTDLPMDEVRALASKSGAAINEAKLVLAFEATKMLHGNEAANAAREAAQKLFASSSNRSFDGGPSAGEPEVLLSAHDVPDLGSGLDLLEFLVIVKVAPSKAEARRIVSQGGLAINDEKVTDTKRKITFDDFVHDKSCLVRKGKKSYVRVRLS